MIDYRLWFDQATGSYVVVSSGIQALAFTATSLTPGGNYKFKV